MFCAELSNITVKIGHVILESLTLPMLFTAVIERPVKPIMRSPTLLCIIDNSVSDFSNAYYCVHLVICRIVLQQERQLFVSLEFFSCRLLIFIENSSFSAIVKEPNDMKVWSGSLAAFTRIQCGDDHFGCSHAEQAAMAHSIKPKTRTQVAHAKSTIFTWLHPTPDFSLTTSNHSSTTFLCSCFGELRVSAVPYYNCIIAKAHTV